MKNEKLIILLFFLLISSFIQGQEQDSISPNGYNILHYPNGKKSSEGYMRDGKPDGYWKTYNEAGILVSQGNRMNFELDSTWQFYDNEGKIVMEINYRNGKKDGIRRIYRQDEIIEENFVNDVKQGLTRYLNPNRKVTKEVFFKDGLENGLAKEYGDDGRIITLITYKNGFITDRELINRYDNNHQKNGLWKYFFPNGVVKKEGYYLHGQENGYFKEYDMDGNLLTTAKYADGVKIYYEDHGSGAAILLTHGYSATSKMWAGQIGPLSENYRVIAWDMRGHGQSDSPSDVSLYSEAHTVDDMAAILDACGITAAVIAGLSLGGYMSLAFNLKYPERVLGLMLFDTGPGYKNDKARKDWNDMARKRAEVLETKGLASLGNSDEVRISTHRSAAGLANAARGMLAQVDDRIIQSLPNIAVPTLVLVGENDTQFLAATDYMANKIPNAAKEIIP